MEFCGPWLVPLSDATASNTTLNTTCAKTCARQIACSLLKWALGASDAQSVCIQSNKGRTRTYTLLDTFLTCFFGALLSRGDYKCLDLKLKSLRGMAVARSALDESPMLLLVLDTNGVLSVQSVSYVRCLQGSAVQSAAILRDAFGAALLSVLAHDDTKDEEENDEQKHNQEIEDLLRDFT